jgi:hypothetical protein
MLPELSEGEPDTPGVRLAFRLGDDRLGISTMSPPGQRPAPMPAPSRSVSAALP